MLPYSASTAARALHGTVNAASAVAGRTAGGVFTLYASTGGRFGGSARAVRLTKVGLAGSNLALASMGALIKLAIKTGGNRVTVADMALAIVAGSAEALFSNELWKQIIRGVQECALEVDRKDLDAYTQLYDALRQQYQEAQRATW